MLEADFRPLPEALVILNIGYHLDNSESIFEDGLNPSQRFSAGINPHDQFLLLLGFAYQLGPVAPFLEYGTAQALGADGLGFGDSPNWLTIGVRAWPLSRHTLHLLAAVDIGLTGIDVPQDQARIPPYNIILSVGYDFGAVPDPEPRVEVREVVKVKEVEVPVPAPPPEPEPKGRVVGQVVDAVSGNPLGNAKVIVEGKETTILLSDPAEGKFATCLSDPGPVKLTVTREGYREEETAVLIENEPEVPVTVKLAPSRGKTFGSLKGTIRAATGQPIRARISIPARKVKAMSSKKAGKFQLKLETGVFDVLISKKGYITQRRKIKLGAGDLVILNVELYPKK
jgi:hypothetical protein